MMLWDIIRDWFVQYVWGGTLSSTGELHGGFLGLFYNSNLDSINGNTGKTALFNFTNVAIDLENDIVFENPLISLGDWLSTTSTIIVLICLVVFLALCVRYLFKFVGGLFKW